MPASITMKPVELDLVLYAGDGFTIQFVFTIQATGLPYVLTGTWLAQVRAPANALTALLSFAIDVSLMATGKVTLSLTGAQTAQILGVKGAYWDLQQTATGDQPRTWYRGRIQASQDVSRV